MRLTINVDPLIEGSTWMGTSVPSASTSMNFKLLPRLKTRLCDNGRSFRYDFNRGNNS